MSKRASVIIVGRMNVGKSTLFNRLSVDVKSITLDYEGVTRDFIRDTICWDKKCFDLIDTGGISLRKTQDILQQKTQDIAHEQLQSADVIIFVVDAKVGVVTEDREIAKLAHKTGKPVILVVNKMDAKISEERVYEFDRLGFKHTFPISAEHGRGIGDLLSTIVELLPDKGSMEDESQGCRTILLGKPNVGKSSLMNLLLHKERSMVSDIPGTTREAITEKISFYQEDIIVTDTPGLRKKRAVTEDLETLMVKSSLRALEHADVVLLLIDISEGMLADQELKLAFYAFTEKYKAVVLIFNKTDLLTDDIKKNLDTSMEEYQYLIDKVPQLYISCVTEKNVGKVLPLVKELWERANQQFLEEDLTAFFKEAMMNKPLFHSMLPLEIYAVRQIRKNPITILMIVNEPKWFGYSQLAYFENVMRSKFKLVGVPIRFVTRKGR